MYLSLVNLFIVLALLVLAMRKLFKNPVNLVLSVFSLFWGVTVTSGLFLSFLNLLGNPWAWFACSVLVSVAIWAVTCFCVNSGPIKDLCIDEIPFSEIKQNFKFDWWMMALVTAGLLLANVVVTLSYPPTNWDTNTYHLPRAFFYMSQGHLGHYPTVDFRQIFFTFNPSLLIIWLNGFELSENLVVLVNPLCWVICFLGVYRLSTLCGASKYSALIVAAIGCLSPGVYAQGASTTTDIQQASLIMCSAVFLFSYVHKTNWKNGILLAVSFGVATGIKVTCFFFGPIILIILFWNLCMHGIKKSLTFLNEKKLQIIIATIVFFWLAVPFMVYNYIYAGKLMTPHFDYLRNKPFEFYGWLQTMYTFVIQAFIQPFKFIFLNGEWLEPALQKYLFPFWNGKYAFNNLKLFTPGFSEDSLWFSFTPYLLLMALINELRTRSHWNRPSFIFLVIALSWFATYCGVSKWGMYTHRYFISAFLLAMPALAMLCDQFYGSNTKLSRTGRHAIRFLFLFIVLQAGVCHLYNYYRPIIPVIKGTQTSNALDILPVKMKETLEGRRDQVNIVQYSWQHQNERQYPYLRVMPDARLKTKQYRMEQEPDVPPQVLTGFNLLSFWGTTEGSFFSTIPASKGWLVIPVENKKSPGVMYLGRVGNGYEDNFKYFSFEPGERACLPGEDNILFFGLHDRFNSVQNGMEIKRFRKLRLLTVGLNKRDGLSLTAYATLKDGTEKVVWITHSDSYKDLLLPRECTKLFIELKDQAGQIRGRGKILTVPFTGKVQKHDIAHISLVHDPVASNIIKVDGMRGYSEGPYTAIGLPKIRWSTDREIRFSFDNDDPFLLEKMFLDLEFKPQATGDMKIFVNGKEVDSYHWGDTDWQTFRTKVSLDKGRNIISLKSTFKERSNEILSAKNVLMFREIQFRGYPCKRKAKEAI